ncbi:hypothetical protein [Sphingomonas trueperi]|uniref:Uncharacterized protein n=1 Tax=Sphingomonas trueperi TaxID=53317 RepID=A0A7X5Y2F5_9SPHN|nr:hypothetical protein [Sphingomonas trueperi]NJB99879.1 hypothetical protein [Sphingomonas trueperi]
MADRETVYWQDVPSEYYAEPDRSAFHIIDYVGSRRVHRVVPRAVFLAQLDQAIRLVTASTQSASVIELRKHNRP